MNDMRKFMKIMEDNEIVSLADRGEDSGWCSDCECEPCECSEEDKEWMREALDVVEGFNIRARMADALSGLAGDDVVRDVIEKESRNVVAKLSSMIPEGHPKEEAVRSAIAELHEYISSATGMVDFAKRCEEAPAKFLGPIMQKGVEEDCDETPMGGEDGECSPFTHADDNVDMVREEGDEMSIAGKLGKLAKVIKSVNSPKQLKAAERYAEMMWDETRKGNISNFGVDMDLLYDIRDDLRAKRAELGADYKFTRFDEELGVFDEDFLIPPKDAKYDAEVEEEDYEDDDDWKMRGGEDGLGPDGHGYDRDMSDSEPFEDANTKVGREFASSEFGGPTGNTHVGRKFASGEIEEGPGDEFGIDDEIVDVGDDEDYEEFDFDSEFDAMMGNTYRFDEEDIVEMNELRKAAGLNEKKIITKADIEAAGGEVTGPASEITGGPGTSTRHDGSDQVRISVAKGFPRFDKWWEEDPKDIMGMIYWQKDQLPPEGEAFDRNWEKVKANLTKKYGAGPVEESTDSRDDYVAFEFDDEKAYYLVADECGEMMEFGMRDEVLIPEQWEDQVIALLTDHGYENGNGYRIAGMDEDLQNGYNDQHSVDHEYDDRFPKGATSSPARELGPAGAKHGDNPMRTPMASVDKEEDDIYESYKKSYRRFRK